MRVNKNFLFMIIIMVGFISGIVMVANVGAKEKIKIGGIVDITGPTNGVGEPYAAGVQDYFMKVNEEGGINGRMIDYFAIDYQYKLPQAMAAYKRLVTQQKVIAIMGYGTGDCKARMPLLNRDKIPQLTSSRMEDLANPTSAYTFVPTASYTDEIKIMLQYIVEHPIQKGRKIRVAFCYSDAEYGRGPIKRLKAEKYTEGLGIEIVDEEIISQKATEVVSQMLNLNKARPDYTILILTPRPGSVTLKDMKKVGVRTKVMGFSYLGDQTLLRLVGKAAKGLMIPSTYTMISETTVRGVKDILEFNRKHNRKRKEFISTYINGWSNGMIMAEAIKRASDNLTGQGIKQALESLKEFSTKGLSYPVTFSATKHKGNSAAKLIVADIARNQFNILTDWICLPQ